MAITDRTLTGGATVPGQRKGAPVGADDETAPRAGRKKKFVGALVLLVALLGAGGGGFVMFTGGAGDEAAVEEEPEPEPGAVVALDPVTINLAEGRYLQVGIALQEAMPEGGGEEEEKLDGSHALDILISTLSGRAITDLQSTEQRDAVKADLVEQIGEAYHGEVYDVYFTSFVMQ
ncbi:flagellar basal body-associated FliL family protein [Aquipuribacter hungaricus]|uniref:Flagellar protein FliL n=1 Tax=Aquipuribacter hungaricus TaxID=545624 RepID=A0ABV7WH78_9MICO